MMMNDLKTKLLMESYRNISDKLLQLIFTVHLHSFVIPFSFASLPFLYNFHDLILQVAEISRVLRPGGVFVATTYILDGPFTAVPFLSTLRQV